jgi:competence protein ComEA
MPSLHWFALCLLTSLPLSAVAPKPLHQFENCTFVPTRWADGDSFRIKTAGGEEHTIRLYGVDCLEVHVQSATDASRLRVQRQYFGITEAAPNPFQAIELAKDFGKQAAVTTTELLSRPFTVHTRFRDARGDINHKRIYAFVTCADGEDLGSTLVKNGLARAFGVNSDTPDGRTLKESAAMLNDLELQAAKRGAGIWAKTDWDKLPAERQAQRKDDEETSLAIAKQPLPDSFIINPNTATREELMKLRGIGSVMAQRIIQNRPFAATEDLMKVPGIGPKKYEAIRAHLQVANP